MNLLVDTFEGYLNNVEVQLFDAPYTTVGTFSGAAITAIEGGSYVVDIGTPAANNWRVILRDANNESLGIKYANADNLFAKDNPPWLESSIPDSIIDKLNLIGAGALQPATTPNYGVITYYNSEGSVQKTLYTSADFTGYMLSINIETVDKIDVATIVDADITKSSTQLNFYLPEAIQNNLKEYKASVRKTDGAVLGTFTIKGLYAPDNPAPP